MWHHIDIGFIIAIIVVGFIFLVPLVFSAGVNEGRIRTERRAVTVGLAVYSYSDDGSPVFVWLSPVQIEASTK